MRRKLSNRFKCHKNCHLLPVILVPRQKNARRNGIYRLAKGSSVLTRLAIFGHGSCEPESSSRERLLSSSTHKIVF